MLILLTATLLLVQEPQARRFPDVPEQDALQYGITLTVDMVNQTLKGTVGYTFAAVEPLTTIRLDALRSDDWQVAFTDMAGNPLRTEWGKDHAIVHLPKEIAKGDKAQFMARLAGKPVDGFYFGKTRYGDPIAFTDHYSIRARGWLPCEDHPADRAKWFLHLIYPEGQEAVAFGGEAMVLLQEPPAGYTARAFAATAEIPPYMFALVVGSFTRVAEKGDQRLWAHYVYEQDAELAAHSLQHHGLWLRTMEETFGPYPYGKYTTVQCPTRWGGFEAPGNVQLAEALFRRPGGGVGTLAHELVHMWFGDGVGYSRWREVWLSEGFASYLGPWLHHLAGGPTLQESLAAMRERWRGSFEGRTKTVRDDSFPHPDRALNANTYPKGAWVLHMLRGEVGDEKFFAALKAYYGKFVGRSVVTSDFVAVVEEETGEELSWFFEQWLDRVGCPELEVAEVDGKVVVRQVQKGAPYRFWLRVRGVGADGKDVAKRLRVAGAETVVPGIAGVEGLLLDPQVELLFR